MAIDSIILMAIKEAGILLNKRFLDRFERFNSSPSQPSQVTFKESKEFVLKDDLESQDILQNIFKRKLQEYSIFSEEMDNLQNIFKEKKKSILIDPLDGTHNYYYGQPQWGISVTVLEENNKVQYAYIYLPFFDYCIYVGDENPGKCVFMSKGEKQFLRPQKAKSIGEALIFYDNQFSRIGERGLSIYKNLVAQSFSTRISGSSAYDIAMVALGRGDGRIWNKGQSYDIFPALAFSQALNGFFGSFDKDNTGYFKVYDNKVIMSGSPELGNDLLNLVYD